MEKEEAHACVENVVLRLEVPAVEEDTDVSTIARAALKKAGF